MGRCWLAVANIVVAIAYTHVAVSRVLAACRFGFVAACVVQRLVLLRCSGLPLLFCSGLPLLLCSGLLLLFCSGLPLVLCNGLCFYGVAACSFCWSAACRFCFVAACRFCFVAVCTAVVSCSGLPLSLCSGLPLLLCSGLPLLWCGERARASCSLVLLYVYMTQFAQLTTSLPVRIVHPLWRESRSGGTWLPGMYLATCSDCCTLAALAWMDCIHCSVWWNRCGGTTAQCRANVAFYQPMLRGFCYG
jgi:hypothetical protein